MKVLQLIDSLKTGGSERMAIAFANELNNHGASSFLCATREEGPLKSSISEGVGYLFLNKKRLLDFAAVWRLQRFIRKHKIEVIHAHSSSFFFGYLIKLMQPSIRLIWHDHYGNSEMLHERNSGPLRFCSSKFHAIISVNELLQTWARHNLKCSKVYFLNNFVSFLSQQQPVVTVKGKQELKIACLANIRQQKDHLTLLKAFHLIVNENVKCSLHLFGDPIDKKCYEELTSYIRKHAMKNVYFYGAQTGVIELLKECDIGVLSSISEGLPVSLLEYGVAGLPVVSTKVGQTVTVISDYGKLVESRDAEGLSKAMLFYLQNAKARQEDAMNFSDHIKKEYSFQKIKSRLYKIYKD